MAIITSSDPGLTKLDVTLFPSLKYVDPSKFAVLPIAWTPNPVYKRFTMAYHMLGNGQDQKSSCSVQIWEKTATGKYRQIAWLLPGSRVIEVVCLNEKPALALVSTPQISAFELDYTITESSIAGTKNTTFSTFEWTIVGSETTFAVPNFSTLNQASSTVTLDGVEQNNDIDYKLSNGMLDWIGTDPALTPGNLLRLKAIYD
jgi:hypothetical protein